MRLATITAAMLALAIIGIGTNANAGAEYGVAGISTIDDSRLALGVQDRGIAYMGINWTLFARQTSSGSITANDVILWQGTVDGVTEIRTRAKAAGATTYEIEIGEFTKRIRVTTINTTAEDWVKDNVLHGGHMITINSLELFWLTIKTHALTMIFFFAPFPLVFVYVRMRKEMEARQIV